MSDDEHAEPSDVAPVIPLFGGARGDRGVVAEPAPPESESEPKGARRFPVRRVPGSGAAEPPAASGDAAPPGERWHTTWRDLGRDGRAPRPAPVFDTVERDGVRFIEVPDHADPGSRRAGEVGAGGQDGPPTGAAERKLLRSLGARGLSVSEARQKLRAQDVEPEEADAILERLEQSGALDDEALAEQLVHAATTRRNEGRRAIAQSLAKRGIRRDVVDRVIAELPDDDAERALEFARTKAPQLARFDDDTALRRLVGQLSRRGYGGLALSVASRALEEQRTASRGVRFE